MLNRIDSGCRVRRLKPSGRDELGKRDMNNYYIEQERMGYWRKMAMCGHLIDGGGTLIA